VTYQVDVSNKAGTPATTLGPTASSVNVDNQTPAISVTAMSSNATTSTYAKSGSTITLTISANDGSNPVGNLDTFDGTNVTLLSGGQAVKNTPTVSGSNGSYTVTYVVASTDTEGQLTYSLNIANKAGITSNNATGGTGTAGTANTVTVDLTAPIIHVVAFTANGSDVFTTQTGSFSNGTNLSLSFYIEEDNPKAAANTMVKIDNAVVASAAFSGGGTSSGDPYIATKTTSGSESGSFSIGGTGTRITDLAGNNAVSSSAGTAGVSYTVGTSSPVANPSPSIAVGPGGILRSSSNSTATSAPRLVYRPSDGQVPSWQGQAAAGASVAPLVQTAQAIPASFTFDRLPVLSDVSSFVRSPQTTSTDLAARAAAPVTSQRAVTSGQSAPPVPATQTEASMRVPAPAQRTPSPSAPLIPVPTHETAVEERRDEETDDE
jgi:hypothetical protein